MVECPVCSKNIARNVEYIACRGSCGKNFHIKCANLSAENFAKLKEDGSIKSWVCDGCVYDLTSKEDVVPIGESSLKQQLITEMRKSMKEMESSIIITLKYEISKLQLENKNLASELREIKQLLGQQKTVSIVDTNVAPQPVDVRTYTTSTLNQVLPNNVDKQHIESNGTKRKVQLAKQVQQNFHNENDKKNYANAVNVNKPNQNELLRKNSAELFTTVRYKSNRKSVQNTIKGTATEIALKGSIQYAHLHMSGFDPTTTEDEIKNYLDSKNIKSIKCNKMQAKRPDEYASFKLSVPLELIDEIKNPNLWPSGVRINRFLEYIFKKTQKNM